jgi:hypothetical protein
MPRLPLNGRNPVHRDPEGARQFVQADPNLVEFVPEQFARVDRRQFPPLCHVSSSLIMATESTGRPLVRLGVPSTVRGIVLDIEAKVAVGRSPPRLRIEETALGHGKRIRQKVGPA